LATQYRIAGGEGIDVGARFLLLMAPIGAVLVCFVDWPAIGRRFSIVVAGLSVFPLVAVFSVHPRTPVTPALEAEYRAFDVGYIVSQNRLLGNFLWQIQPYQPFVYASPEGDRTVEEVANLFDQRTDKPIAIVLSDESEVELSGQYCQISAPQNERIGLRIYVARGKGTIPCR
jgi:hypothetical protein